MKQILGYEPGGPDQMALADVPTPMPPSGHVLVAIHISGVNFLDVYFRSGLYKSDRPIAIGSEAAGVIAGVGEGVSGLQVGDRVAYTMVRGTYAEYAVVPAVNVVRIPGCADVQTAAAVLLQGATAHYLTRSTFPLNDSHACRSPRPPVAPAAWSCRWQRRGRQVIGTVWHGAKAREISRSAPTSRRLHRAGVRGGGSA